MKIKRGRPPKTSDAPAPTPIDTPTPPKAPIGSKNRTRVLLTVIDGKIDWQKMTAESRKQFEQMFANSEFLKQFGLSAKSKEWDPETIKEIYAGLGWFYQVLGTIMRLSPRAIETLAYTEQEKDVLAEPTAKLADEYSSEWVQKHQTLVVWLTLFAAVNGTKIKSALAITAQDRAREAAGARPRAVPSAPAAPGRPVNGSAGRPVPVNGSAIAETPRAAEPVRAPEPEVIPIEPGPKPEPTGESLEDLPTPQEFLRVNPDAPIVTPI